MTVAHVLDLWSCRAFLCDQEAQQSQNVICKVEACHQYTQFTRQPPASQPSKACSQAHNSVFMQHAINIGACQGKDQLSLKHHSCWLMQECVPQKNLHLKCSSLHMYADSFAASVVCSQGKHLMRLVQSALQQKQQTSCGKSSK